MPDFAYIARDMTGQKVTGVLSANTRQEALSALGTRSLFPLEVKAEAARAARWTGKRVKPQMLATFYGQLADLLRSGVPLLRSLDVLSKQTSHQGLKAVLESLHSQVSEGTTVADAMLRHPTVFNDMAVSMIRAGAEGGFLEEALERVGSFTEMQEDLKSRVAGALAYPIFLAVVGTIVVTVLVIFFVPQFAELFDDLRRKDQLPVATSILLFISDTLRSYGIFIAAALIGGAYYARVTLKTEEGQLWRDKWLVRLPVAGKIFLNLAVARFCRVLGTLLRNGVPILKSLDISSGAAGNRMLAKAITDAAENISAGQSLAAPLAKSNQFPASVIEMITVAEEANTLETVLITTADGLEKRTWRQLDLFVRLLEPVMLLILAMAVLSVVIALLLPVIKMSSTL